jgi:hypothetical protein
MAEFKVEMRLNNALFFCRLEAKWYNVAQKTCIAIGEVAGLMPNPSGGTDVNMQPMFICEDCYIKGKEGSLGLEDPSNIIIPKNHIPKIDPKKLKIN